LKSFQIPTFKSKTMGSITSLVRLFAGKYRRAVKNKDGELWS